MVSETIFEYKPLEKNCPSFWEKMQTISLHCILTRGKFGSVVSCITRKSCNAFWDTMQHIALHFILTRKIWQCCILYYAEKCAAMQKYESSNLNTSRYVL